MELTCSNLIYLSKKITHNEKYIHFNSIDGEYLLEEIELPQEEKVGKFAYKIIPAILDEHYKLLVTRIEQGYSRYNFQKKPTSEFFYTAKILSELEIHGSKYCYLFVNDFLNSCRNLKPYNKKIFCKRLTEILSNIEDMRIDYNNISKLIIFDYLQEKTK